MHPNHTDTFDAMQAAVDVLKRLQGGTPVNHTGQAAAELHALLRKAFKGEL